MHAHPSHQPALKPRGRRRVGWANLSRLATLAVAGSAGLAPGAPLQPSHADRHAAHQGPAQAQSAQAPAGATGQALARDLLEGGDPSAIRDALLGEEASQELVIAIAASSAESADAPHDAVLDALAHRLAQARSGAEASAILAALARASTKPAIQACIDALQAGAFPAEPGEIVALLVRITGREDLGREPQAWIAWWESARWLPEADWRGKLARWRGERARRLERERDEAHARLAAALREMHARLPEAERADRLAALLRDDWAVVRQVGLELAERDLLNARAIGPKVVEGALENLANPDVGVRRAAAALLARVPNSGAAVGARQALEREADPEAAAALLRIAAREPTPAVCRVAVDWLGRRNSGSAGGSAEGAAVEAAVALLLTAGKAGALESPSVRSRAVDALRGRDPASLSPQAWELLIRLGGEADRQRLLALIRQLGTASQGQAVARRESLWLILASWPDTARRVLESASTSPAPPAEALVQAASTLGEPAAVLALLARVEGASSAEEAESWRASAARACLALPPESALEVAGQADEAFRVTLLRQTVDAGPEGRPALRALFPILLEAAIRASELELAGDAGQALAGDASSTLPGPDQPQTLPELIVAALAASDRWEEAERFSGDVETWLAALHAVERDPWPGRVARKLAGAIFERFPDALTPEQAQRVRRLREGPDEGRTPGESAAEAG